MDKIQKEFEKYKFRDKYYVIFQAGYKSADLLPTEKVCPECGGDGTIKTYPERIQVGCEVIKCPICKGSKVIQIYYTPEQFKAITRKDYPDDGPVWVFLEKHDPYLDIYRLHKIQNHGVLCVIANEAGKPAADYKPGE